MIGAALAGVLYRRSGHILGAIAGEIIGTGLLGGLLAFPVAKFILGTPAGAFFFIIPFLVSTTGGSVIAWLLYQTPVIAYMREKLE